MKCMKGMPSDLIIRYADQMLAECGEQPAYALAAPTAFETRVVEQVNGTFVLAPKGAAARVVRPVMPAGLKAHGFD